MVEQQRNLILLARSQAAIGGLIAVSVFALYGLKSSLLASASAPLAAAVLGTLGVIYFLTFHQVLGRRQLTLSTMILTIITILNFILVIATTGGLDSPFYSLWLLAIITAGIFGTRETIVILSITVVYFMYEMLLQGFNSPHMSDHLILLILTLLAAGLAEWIHSRNRSVAAQSTKLQTLSGKLTEEQLKAQALMSSINEGVVVVDETGHIKLFNKAAQQLTGWDESSAENIDYNLVLQLHTADDKEVDSSSDPFKEVWAKKKPVVHNDLVVLTRSGRKIQINLSVSPITDNAGALTGAIGLFRDISHEKIVERQKDEFVSTASHEMRTPVAAIEGYISLATNPNVATIDDRAKKYLDKAHETIRHLGELFRDLLSVAKAEEGQLNAKIEPVNMAELLRSAVDDMQFSAQKKGLTLILQTSGSTGKTITPLYYIAASPERMREVVMNLIDNAIKYTAEGGIKVTLDGNDKEVKVSINDTGVGIATEDIPHLFQKFYRIDNSATRTIGGTGLGLYLCRQMIELFNGRIWVESAGHGSTFNISLPRITEEEAKRLLANAATPTTQTTTVIPGGVVQPGSAAGPAITQRPVAMPVPAEQEDPASHRVRIQ